MACIIISYHKSFDSIKIYRKINQQDLRSTANWTKILKQIGFKTDVLLEYLPRIWCQSLSRRWPVESKQQDLDFKACQLDLWKMTISPIESKEEMQVTRWKQLTGSSSAGATRTHRSASGPALLIGLSVLALVVCCWRRRRKRLKEKARERGLSSFLASLVVGEESKGMGADRNERFRPINIERERKNVTRKRGAFF